MMIIFDTETTGLTYHPSAPLHLQPKVIEFGAVVLDGGSIVREVEYLIDPGEPITAEITKITGITDEMVRGKPSFAEVEPHLRKLFEGMMGMAAHNLPFDRAVLGAELARLGLEWEWPVDGLCTVSAYREQFGFDPKLTQLYEARIGKPLAQTHRGLDDVRALAEIIIKDRLWELYE